MEDWQLRAVKEKEELDKKLSALTFFIERTMQFESLPTDERLRLINQEKCMLEYSQILAARINHFGTITTN